MADKIEMKLLVHPNDYAIAAIAAELLKTTIEDFCLIALAREASREVRIARLTSVIDGDTRPNSGGRSTFMATLLQRAFPNPNLNFRKIQLNDSSISTGDMK